MAFAPDFHNALGIYAAYIETNYFWQNEYFLEAMKTCLQRPSLNRFYWWRSTRTIRTTCATTPRA